MSRLWLYAVRPARPGVPPAYHRAFPASSKLPCQVSRRGAPFPEHFQNPRPPAPGATRRPCRSASRLRCERVRQIPRPRQRGAVRRAKLPSSNARSAGSRRNPPGIPLSSPRAGGRTGRAWDRGIRGALAARKRADRAAAAGRSREFLLESSCDASAVLLAGISWLRFSIKFAPNPRIDAIDYSRSPGDMKQGRAITVHSKRRLLRIPHWPEQTSGGKQAIAKLNRPFRRQSNPGNTGPNHDNAWAADSCKVVVGSTAVEIRTEWRRKPDDVVNSK